MNFDVAVNGRPWKVAVDPAEQPDQFTIVVKGKKRVVNASWVDADTLSLIDGSVAREVRINRRDSGALGVAIGGRVFEAVVSKRGGKTPPDPIQPVVIAERFLSGAAAAKPDSAPGGTAAVKSPMPGRVVRVLVAVGDRVTARQALVVVEAMKMENELRSPKNGVVTEISAVPGTAVEAGAVLVVIGD